MRLNDVYKHKTKNKLIQIDSFATPMGKFPSREMIIVFSQFYKEGNKILATQSQYGYGSEEEIEKEYELFVPEYELHNYDSWSELYKKLEEEDESI